jgi:putative glycosyltransferase (TIGR04348 family)
MPQSRIVIVSPALQDANNGNWQTARRWQKFLTGSAASGQSAPRIVQHWRGISAEDASDEVMLALHARRSADSAAAWHAARGMGDGASGLCVVLTGTDLYRDIHSDAAAQHSIAVAQRLVVLQELGAQELPQALRSKATAIFQSTSSRLPYAKATGHLHALMVGHLRDEKSPQTYLEAAGLVAQRDDILLDHIGDGLDPALAKIATDTAAACPHYRWLGGLPHQTTRTRIQRVHVLVHASRMEGGAHVVMEAVCSATPVLASRISGNVGMLGTGYSGYFDWGNAKQLAKLLERCRDEPAFLDHLAAQCALRAPLFAPLAEKASLLALVAQLGAGNAKNAEKIPKNAKLTANLKL